MLRVNGHSVTVERGPSPSEQVPHVECVTENSPPEHRLTVLRAKQISGQHVDPDEYDAVRTEVIENADPEVHVLWKYLEKTYDCEVCELVKEGSRRRPIYGFKIRTPKGTFLDWATREELLCMFDKLEIRR